MVVLARLIFKARQVNYLSEEFSYQEVFPFEVNVFEKLD